MAFRRYVTSPRILRGLDRRSVLAGAAASTALQALPTFAAEEQSDPVRITLPTPGSAGSVWRPAIAKLGPAALDGLRIDWIAGDPGQMQGQLAAGALDVGVFGAVGLANLLNRGSDIVLFGPALNNHGRWIVRGDS